jgi:hypothetical protein
MTSFPVNTIDSAPEGSKPAMRQLQATFGTLPNIAGSMSTSPVLINRLIGLFQNVHGGSFTEAEVQMVLLTDAVTNACTWAVAFHTARRSSTGLIQRMSRPFVKVVSRRTPGSLHYRHWQKP